MASASGTSPNFRLPAPDTIEEITTLSPPSIELIEANWRLRIKEADQLHERLTSGFNRLERLAAKTTAAVGSRTLSDIERTRSWHLLEKEVKRASEAAATVHKENVSFMSYATVYQAYMWKYYKNLEKCTDSMNDMEASWARERRFLINLCKHYIPVEAAERVYLDEVMKVLQDEQDSGEEGGEGEDVSLGFLADMYTERIWELKAQNKALEQEIGTQRTRAILSGAEVPAREAQGNERAHSTQGDGSSSRAVGVARPSRVLHGSLAQPQDTELSRHLVDLFHETRDLMLDLFTSNAIPWHNGRPEHWKTAWLNFNKHFQALRLLSKQMPPSLSKQAAELDLEIGEPMHLRSQKTDQDWQPFQTEIERELNGKGKQELLAAVRECKATSARVTKEVMDGGKSWWMFWSSARG